MKRVPEALLLVVFAVCAVFFACSGDKNEGDNSSSSQCELCNPDNPSDSSSSETSAGGDPEPPEVPSCAYAYLPIWCGGIAFDNVKKESMNEADIGATSKGQERPNCIYATAITQIGNESGGISINGTTFATGSASRCGGDSGHGYGSTTACATKFANVAKADGGYYIYIPSWAGQDFKTTGGEPACGGTTPITPGTSSSSTQTSNSSSSGGGSTSGCVDPMYGVPPNGVTSCVKKDGKCYTCNPERGNDCTQPWVWQATSISDWWYKEVSCTETSGGGGGTTYNLTCTGLAQTGVAGTAITQPTVKCNADNATATFASAPNWNNPVAGTFNVNATASCGGSSKTASCGTIVVSAAPTASTLTCTGLPATGVAGTAITQPTVKCGSTTVSSPSFTGAPTWANPTANTYNVSANATGACTQAASCGTIKVNPKLTCGNPNPATVIAGDPVTAPTVTCGTTTIANTGTNISWSGAPDYWSAPASGTYNNIRATANTGDCNGQTATCGSLTVNNKLNCGSATAAITTGQTPPKPTVTCGTTTVTSGITWNPAAMNSNPTTAQTINNITAGANCGGSNQTANCSGTITVTAPSSSSASGGVSSNSGGSPSYVPTAPGNETSKVTHYWDACKPSCSWSGKGGLQANSCNITGTNIGHNDGDASACQGGNAFACMYQAPRKIGNVSFGYVAAAIGNCGDCWQFDFPNNQVMVVMKTNIGDIKEGAKFDLMVPGGGVGDFNALTRQVQQSGISNPDMGVTYGGFRGACGWSYSASNANCVKQKCESVFANLPDLKAGCLWYVNTLTDDASWNNPTVRYKQVTCPSELTSRY